MTASPALASAILVNGNYASGTSGCTVALVTATITITATCATGYAPVTISAVNYCLACNLVSVTGIVPNTIVTLTNGNANSNACTVSGTTTITFVHSGCAAGYALVSVNGGSTTCVPCNSATSGGVSA